jgi:hypothetical protein
VIGEYEISYKTKNVALIIDWNESNIEIDEETGRPKNDSIQDRYGVVGDTMKITLVFRNLLSNALVRIEFEFLNWSCPLSPSS